ncbi:short-subunit dehydrogenase [Sediminihabitans luteus]|uniref:Short-subunit dehydrogenase n=1 Tax=Sediminihabitans luteus TaxID=1138585 RepID=A0A2M9CE65_9CELL|nr:SDR family NAD(P)-dependent oxidoreductase [Sediminihabitans luteus]PJJ70226.1 short-subunit dehydrogenase [Sediminihabitans luteus]GII97697.1 short-chain dehydrogenase [Sediminihabitans luteus]
MGQRTIVITGASDGIGAAAARQLAARGERLLLVGRRRDKLEAVARPLGAETFVADFERLSDVRTLAQEIQERTDRIDVLANNAGGVFAERVVTEDGNERTMQVNHYAGFLLTNLLIDVLLASDAKVVNTSSVGAHAFGKIDLADLDATTKYKTMKAYGDSKLANILFAKGLHARYHDQGLSAVALHPGNIASNFGKETGNAMMKAIYKSPLARLLSTPESGADNLVWAMDGTPGVTWQSGEYYTDKRKPNPQQDDAALATALWAESARRTGLTPTLDPTP